jgi:hypothetical protein
VPGVAAFDHDDARPVRDRDEGDLDERRERIGRVPPEGEVLVGAHLVHGGPARLPVAQDQLALGPRLELERAVVGEPALEVGDGVPGRLRVDGQGDLAGDVH